MSADLYFLALFLLLVLLAWVFVHLCDWLTEPSGDRYAGEEPKR
jgi:hypothetical protein